MSSNFSDDQPYSWSQKPFHPKTFKYKNAKVCTNSDGTMSKNLICPVITEFQPLGTLPDIGTNKSVSWTIFPLIHIFRIHGRSRKLLAGI